MFTRFYFSSQSCAAQGLTWIVNFFNHVLKKVFAVCRVEWNVYCAIFKRKSLSLLCVWSFLKRFVSSSFGFRWEAFSTNFQKCFVLRFKKLHLISLFLSRWFILTALNDLVEVFCLFILFKKNHSLFPILQKSLTRQWMMMCLASPNLTNQKAVSSHVTKFPSADWLHLANNAQCTLLGRVDTPSSKDYRLHGVNHKQIIIHVELDIHENVVLSNFILFISLLSGNSTLNLLPVLSKLGWSFMKKSMISPTKSKVLSHGTVSWML